MRRKIVIEDCHNLAANKNGKFLSKAYVGSKFKYLWECDKSHQWNARHDQIKAGHWCGTCAKTKITKEQCILLASKKDGYFLSDEYITSAVRYLWGCKYGHTWKTKYHKIKKGTWCFECRKYSAAKCHELAKAKDGYFLSELYINSRTKYKWECSKRHQWYALYKGIKYGGWCPECNKISIEDYHKVAKLKDGKFLSLYITNNRTKHLWECKEKHQWYARYDNIQAGKWCPDCAANKFVSKGETEWLDSLGIPIKNRNRFLRFGDMTVNVDGYYNNTVYQFHGDYWHGNPVVFSGTAINPHLNKSFDDLFKATIAKDEIVKKQGLKLVVMWENDWNKIR